MKPLDEHAMDHIGCAFEQALGLDLGVGSLVGIELSRTDRDPDSGTLGESYSVHLMAFVFIALEEGDPKPQDAEPMEEIHDLASLFTGRALQAAAEAGDAIYGPGHALDNIDAELAELLNLPPSD